MRLFKASFCLIFSLVIGLVTAQNDPTCEGRRIEHAAGTTCVSENPQRVVVLDTGELDSALALGIKPVGAVTAFTDSEFLTYLDAEGITPVGTIEEPNLEAILALQPDLILSSKLRHENLYGLLSQIAPTVFTETVGVVWKENLLKHGEALGRLNDAQALLANYTARTTKLREGFGGELPTVSMVRFLPGEIRLYQKASFIGTILEDVGLPRPPLENVDDFAAVISDESIPEISGDIIFVTSYGPRDETEYDRIAGGPLWQTLPAVQADHVYAVPDDYWMLGIGIGAANRVLDDMQKYLSDYQN